MPDIFGNPTPLEAQMQVQEAFRARQREFANSAMAASPGAQAGQALANIFAPMIRKGLDTREARKTEVERIMAATPTMTEADAKKLAKERIKPEYYQVRRAQRYQEHTSKIGPIREYLVEQGMTDIGAQTKARLLVANDLADAGFVAEAQAIRQQALEEFRAEEKRVAELDNLRAETDETKQNTLRDKLDMDTDTDTYVYLPSIQVGEPLQVSEVRLTDTETRDMYDKPGSGWVKAPASWLTATLDDATVTGKRPITNEQQEALIANFGMLAGLDVLEAAVPYAGVDGVFPTGFFNRWRGEFGLGPQDVIDAVTVEKKMAADVQSLVKGIPSNYDAKIFERLIPRLGAIKSRRYYESAIQLLKDATREAVEMRIAFHKGTNQEIPQEVVTAAQRVGIVINDVAINEQWRDKDYRTEAVKAWEQQNKARLDALSEQNVEPGSTESHDERKRRLLQGMPGS